MLTLDKLSATPDGALPRTALLGVLAMYHMPDRTVDAKALRKAWKAAKLPEDLVPDDVKPINVFKRACDSVRTRRGGDERVEVSADIVKDTAERCVYQITRLERDARQEVIKHKRTLMARFNKHDSTVDFLGVTDQPEVAGLMQAIRDYIDANTDRVPSATVRAMVRDCLLCKARATSLRKRSGGVYFVPIAAAEMASGLTDVLHAVYGDDADMQQYPVLNNETARDMVRKQHDANVQEDLTELINTARERIKKGGTLRKEFLTKILGQRRELGKRMESYAELLGNEQELAGTKAEIADAQIEKLMEMAG